MYYVYLIQSIKSPHKNYIGYSANLKERLKKHNWGGYKYTTKDRPWRLIMYLCFVDREKAIAFEKYLKSGSGNSFAKKRLW